MDIPNEILSIGHEVQESGQSSPRDPIGDSSSEPDSNYSCDKEGYYTSMHTDTGVERGKPSSTTVQALDENNRLSSDSGAEDLQSPSSGKAHLPVSPTYNHRETKGRNPIMCQLKMAQPSDGSPPCLPPRNMSGSRLDAWLIDRFRAEVAQKESNYSYLQPPEEVCYANPVRKAVRFCK